MRTLTKYLAAALIIGATVGATGGAAEARVTVGFDFGNVALGYSDGYYDNAHHWHGWRRHADAVQWQHDHADNYHGWRHNDKRHHD